MSPNTAQSNTEQPNRSAAVAPSGRSQDAGHGAGFMPRVKFGLQAAVLAGVLVAAGGTTVGLGSPISALAGPLDTTCCGVTAVAGPGV
jgi:hypothetical protein